MILQQEATEMLVATTTAATRLHTAINSIEMAKAQIQEMIGEYNQAMAGLSLPDDFRIKFEGRMVHMLELVNGDARGAFEQMSLLLGKNVAIIRDTERCITLKDVVDDNDF